MVENSAIPVILVTHPKDATDIVVIISLYFIDKNGRKVLPPTTEACINNAMSEHNKEGLIYLEIDSTDNMDARIYDALSRTNSYSNSALFIAVQTSETAQAAFCYLEKHYSIRTG